MTIVRWIAGAIFSLALIVTALMTSFEAALYCGLDFYEKEYRKYDVAADVDMEMKDILYVTDKMMKYLSGDREELQVETVVSGENVEFFNDREIAHMEDVRYLFEMGFLLRNIGLFVMAGSLFFLLLTSKRVLFILSRSIKYGIIIFIILMLALGTAMWANFNKIFTLFHKIFFTNDLWILNPETDRLINILPEGFFLDTVIRIGTIAGCALAILLILAMVIENFVNRKQIKRKRG